MKKPKINWFKLAMIIMPAIRKGLQGIEDAMSEDSDSGEKVTDDEAGDIAAAILSEIHEPLVRLIIDAL